MAATPPQFKKSALSRVVSLWPRTAGNASAEELNSLGPALKKSLIVHGAVFVVLLLKSLVFPGTPSNYVPTLRVDLVGLPDILKKDLSKIQPLPSAEEESKPSAAKEKVEKADPNEMLIKPKAKADERSKKNLRSLERIKALSKIQEDEDTIQPKQIRGNVLSKGSSLSGDARESGEPSYLDTVRDRLQARWELNPYLARQNLSAQVRIFIDSSGNVRSMQFVKASGNAGFDAAVKRTVQASAPFPRPPKGILSSILLDGVLVGFPL